MPVAVAQQAGHEERPSLFDPARQALAFTGDTPINDGAQGTGAVGNVPDVKPSFAPAPAPPRDVGSGGSGGRGSEEGDPGRQGTDSQGAGAPTPTAPKSAVPAEPRVKVGEVPDPDQAAMAARQSRGRGGGRIVQLSKGGDIRSSFTRVPGQEIPEEARTLLTGDDWSPGAQQRAEAAGLSPEETFLAQTQGTLAEDVHDRQTQNIVQLQQRDIEARQENIRREQEAIRREEQRRVSVDKMIRERQAQIQQRDAESAKLTPQSAKEVWASRSTFQQIGAAIQMALGGYLQGLQGRANNPGYDMVMQGITQEVADQRARYEASIAKGEQARGDYAEAVALYGTPEAAALELEARRLDAAAKLTENAAREIGTQEYMQAAALQSAALRAQKGDVLLKLSQLENDRIVQENFQYAPPQYAQIGGGAVKPEERALAVRLPDGSYGYARSADQARKAQEQIKVDARISNAAQRLRHLRSLPGAKTDPKVRGQIEGAAADLFLGLKQGANLGTLDKGSLDFREEWLGDPTAIVDLGGADAKLGEVATAARGRVVDTVRYDLQADPKSLEPILETLPGSATPEQ